MRIENSIEIEAPASRVWELTLDVESWPRLTPTMDSLTPTMDSVERLDAGPLGVGSRARIKQPGQAAKVWTVTRLDQEKAFAWSAPTMGTTMTALHDLEQTNGRTVNTLTVEIEGGLAPLIGRLLRRPILAAITKENQGFKTAAEQRA